MASTMHRRSNAMTSAIGIAVQGATDAARAAAELLLSPSGLTTRMPVFAARTTGFEGEIVSMPLKSSYCQTGFDQKNNLSPMSTKRTTNPRRLSICGSSCCAVAMGSSLLLFAVVLDSTNSTGIFALHALDGQARQAAQGRCLHFPHHTCLILARGHSRRPACQGSRSWAIHSNAPVDLDLLNYLVEHRASRML